MIPEIPDNPDIISDSDLADYLLTTRTSEHIIPALFNLLPIACTEFIKINLQQFNELVLIFDEGDCDRAAVLTQIIALLRSAVTLAFRNDKQLLESIQNYITLHLTEDFSIKQMASDLNISYYYMCHLFRKCTGSTLSQYRNELRIEKAKAMLSATNMKITEIATDCGFENTTYFTEVFTKMMKMSPNKFRSELNSPEYLSFYNEEDLHLLHMLPFQKLLDISERNASGSYSAQVTPVHLPDQEYSFLHEAAIIEYHGILYASWYNCPVLELKGHTPIRGRRSKDGGNTWSEVEIIAEAPGDDILYCPPVYGICNDTLYLFLNQMVAPDHIHTLDLYVLNPETDRFEQLWSRPIPFKLNTNVYQLPNGKLMLPGRMGELDRFPNTPAVLISDNGKIDTEWRLVKIAENGFLPDGEQYVHPEISAIVLPDKIYMFCRNDRRNVPIFYYSEDNGETWSGPVAHNIPFINSKIYSGTLADGRHYVIGNILKNDRTKLALYLTDTPGCPSDEVNTPLRFSNEYLLCDGYDSEFPNSRSWHYPCAIESESTLKIICTLQYTDKSRGAVLISVPLTE